MTLQTSVSKKVSSYTFQILFCANRSLVSPALSKLIPQKSGCVSEKYLSEEKITSFSPSSKIWGVIAKPHRDKPPLPLP